MQILQLCEVKRVKKYFSGREIRILLVRSKTNMNSVKFEKFEKIVIGKDSEIANNQNILTNFKYSEKY